METITVEARSEAGKDAQRYVRLMTLAEAELSALMWTIDASAGPQVAIVAGRLWVQALESTDMSLDDVHDWRAITAATIHRLSEEGLLLKPNNRQLGRLSPSFLLAKPYFV